MSGEEIHGADTGNIGVVTVEAEGERLIQMLSVIASKAERNYDHHEEQHNIVTLQKPDGSDQMAQLLATMEEDAQAATLVHIDPRHVVQQEVVVGTPEVNLVSGENAVPLMIQTIQASDLRLEDVHAIQQQQQSEQNELVPPPPPTSSEPSNMVFMTNYRDYTIMDIDGKILIGERKKLLNPTPENKIVPVTDNSSGYTFEYQYRARGTVKRFECKKLIVYFIGQISNERILALFYQTVFQLVTKMGTIDLDKEYTSGKRVLSGYYQSIAPSTARTIRAPVEKLTYMKLLFIGDVDENEDGEIIMIADGEPEPTKPSKKLKASNIFKPSRRKYKKTVVADQNKTPKAPEERLIIEDNDVTIQIVSADDLLNAVESGQENEIELHVVTGENPDISTAEPRQADVIIDNRPIASRNDTPVKIPKKRGRKPKGYWEEQNKILSETSRSPRASSRRVIKRPSKFTDYLDMRKKIKQELPSDHEEEVGESPGDEEFKPQKGLDGVNKKTNKTGRRKSSKVGRPSGHHVEKPTQNEVMKVVTTVETDTPELEKANGNKNAENESTANEYENVESENVPAPSNEKDTNETTPKETASEKNVTSSSGKKRGPGRPRKYPTIRVDDTGATMTKSLLHEEWDELVMKKKKYPSCQFQRAQNLMKYLCQKCLTDHEDPVIFNEQGELTSNTCHIVAPEHSFKDQPSTSTATGVCSLMSLPTSLSVKVAPETKKLKVCSGQEIPPYTEFGPLVGILLNEDDIQTDTDLSHVWFLQQEEDGEKFFLYTGDENASNWCHYLDPVPPGNSYNMVMLLREEGIFFTSSKRIAAGQELKVFIPYFGNRARPAAAMAQTECLHCQRSFRNSLDYQKHYHIFHPGGFTKQKQKCRLCNRSFPSLKSLHQHMATDHEGQGAFECEKCASSFPNPARLRIHIRDVHPPPDAAVTCDKCGKVYRSKRALANHNTNVHSQFKFACEICGKWFDRRNTLLRHQRLHSGQFSHHCSRCGKGFRDLYNLKVHTLTHSGIRPFSCIYCQNCNFSNRGCLRNHYQTVHSLTEDNMPELNRNIPFTLDAYSGGNPSPEKAPATPQTPKRINRVGRPKAVMVASEPIVDINTLSQQGELPPEKVIIPKKVQRKGGKLSQQHRQVLISAGLLQEQGQGEPSEVHLHIEEDGGSTGMQLQQVVEESMAIDIPMVVEEVKGDVAGTNESSFTTQLVEAEQVADGDHCYYALNVDGQQVLVPATEEVCVIVENENTVTIPASCEETVETME